MNKIPVEAEVERGLDVDDASLAVSPIRFFSELILRYPLLTLN